MDAADIDEVAPRNVVPEELQEGAVDISEEKDGGILKVILKEGSGDEGPGNGDYVTVHYTGTLANGEKFDSSRDRDDKFKFKLGQGQVIKAWDQGVATMKRGELCRLICRSDYAYGKGGSPPKIPGDATLVFEVELFEWEGEDLTEFSDGGIIRSQKVVGTGYITPNEGSSVKVEVTGTYDGKVFDERTLDYTLGDATESNLPDGIDVALKKFKKGEKSELILSGEYGFGSEGCPQYNIPADSTVKYVVNLIDLEKAKESWEMDPSEKISQSELAKTKGTNFFKASQFNKALKKYKLVIKWLDDDLDFSDEQKAQRTALRLAAHLNCALCYNKAQNWAEAKRQCNEALEFDEKSEKALFRRGQAFVGTKDWKDAREDFKAVLELDPKNKTAKNQLTIAEHHLKQEREKEKKLYANMFAKKAADEPATKTSEKTKEETKVDTEV